MTALPKLRTALAEIEIAGLAAALDLSGALYLPDEDALVVADLHFEKGSAYARRGSLLPPYDTRETIGTLASAIERFRPGLVIALGDSFHDIGGPERLGEGEREAIAILQAGRDWIWVRGNHDHALPPAIGGEVARELAIGDVVLRHEPAAAPARDIAGHLHPVGKVAMRGRSVRRRCFVTDGERCLLPAFGAYAGGLNACDPAIRGLFPRGFIAHLIGDHRLFAIGHAMLRGD